MTIDKELLDILICPKSKGTLRLSEDGQYLICDESRLKYPIQDGIPTMLVEEAKPLEDSERQSK